MSEKIIYIDLETTGVDPKKNGILQFAGIIEIDGKEVETIEAKIQPFKEDVIEDEALGVNGIKREEIPFFLDPHEFYLELIKTFSKYVGKFKREDKFHFIGYNAKFDDDFLREFFKKNTDYYYGSWFYWPPIDVANIAALRYMKSRSEFNNFKLTTVAKYAGIDFELSQAHDAIFDIRLTKRLLEKVIFDFKNPNQPERGTQWTKQQNKLKAPGAYHANLPETKRLNTVTNLPITSTRSSVLKTGRKQP